MAWDARWDEPEAVGWIERRLVRCGKRNCRCARDPAARHGPYTYLVWREYSDDEESRRVRKRYVPAAQVAALAASIAAVKAEEVRGREEFAELKRWWRGVKRLNHWR